MKNQTLNIVVIILISCFGFSQNGGINEEFPEAKKEVKQALDDIESYIRNNQTDKLISMHAYGPKFTEFETGGKRQGSKENENFERNFLGTINKVHKWDWEDLKISVYGGDVANVTFHSNFKFERQKEQYDLQMQGTLLFVKTDDGWKIVHEHLAPIAEAETKTEVTEIKHISKHEFPKDNMINILKDWGGMVVAINEPEAGTDFTPLLEGQKDDLCQVPHWGYLEKGKLEAKYQKKPWKTISAGEVFYMPPGHTTKVVEDARIIDFSPQEEMIALMADIENKLKKDSDK